MKPEDINYILNIIPNFSYGRSQGLSDEDTIRKSNQVWHELEDALEKQVAKKPIHAHRNYYCPTCKDTWLLWDDAIPNESDNFCGYCGQKIDWSDEE